jgi:hypothetical protein
MAPFLRLAKAAGDEDEFYKTFFKFWFKRWPETPTNDSGSVEIFERNIKKVRTDNAPTVAILMRYLINRGLKAITYIF